MLSPLIALASVQITGAFGISFDQPVDASQLGASLDRHPVTQIEEFGWHYLQKPLIPQVFEGMQAHYYVQIDTDGMPLSLSALVSEPCETIEYLDKALSRHYKEKPLKQSDGEHAVLQWKLGARAIDARCLNARTTALTYSDNKQIDAHLQLLEASKLSEQSRAQRIVNLRQTLDEILMQRFADTFTLGDHYRMQGAFGVYFSEPWNGAGSAVADAEGAISFTPNPADPDWETGEFSLTLAYDGKPMRLSARFTNHALFTFERVAHALHAKYKQAIKDGDTHKIFKINGNFAVVKALDANTVELSFIDAANRKADRAYLWAEEIKGL